MNLSEFKAWLEGFSEAFGEAPSPEQWAKVREKLALVYDAVPVVPQPYYPPPVIEWPHAPAWPGTIWCGPAVSTTNA